MLNIFQCYILWSIKVHGVDYDFTIDHNFYQYQMALFALFNTLCLKFYTVHLPHCFFSFFWLPSFLFIYAFGPKELQEDGIMSFRDEWNRVLHLLSCSRPFSLAIQTWNGGMRCVRKWPALVWMLWFPAPGWTEKWWSQDTCRGGY